MTTLKTRIQTTLSKLILYLHSKFNTTPNEIKIHAALTKLYDNTNVTGQTLTKIIDYNELTGNIVIISDIHKGAGNSADDFKGNTFASSKVAYLNALNYYNNHNYTYIQLGDAEELWEANINDIATAHADTYELEKQFVQKNKFLKVNGNHDSDWAYNYNGCTSEMLQTLYGNGVPIYEAVLLKITVNNSKLNILLTHGHQGDRQSDGNKLSRWFVHNVWRGVQNYLGVNLNLLPSKYYELRNKHNKVMYNWAITKQQTLLITGHTHCPVFASHTHINQLKMQLTSQDIKKDLEGYYSKQKRINALKINDIAVNEYEIKKPVYYNTGCACYSSGSITTLEISAKGIHFAVWKNDGSRSGGDGLQFISFTDIINAL